MAKRKVAAEKPELQADAATPTMLPPGAYMREQGYLWLNDKFEKDTIFPIIAAIQEYNMMEKDIAPQQIILFINSPGGEIHWALPLINAIKMSEIPVVTVADGLAASCGCMLLMCGDKRVAMSNATIMSHQYSAGSAGKEHELYSRVKMFESVSERLLDIYKKHCKKNEKYIRKHLLCESDVWLTPEEAQKHGIIDEVWEAY